MAVAEGSKFTVGLTSAPVELTVTLEKFLQKGAVFRAERHRLYRAGTRV